MFGWFKRRQDKNITTAAVKNTTVNNADIVRRSRQRRANFTDSRRSSYDDSSSDMLNTVAAMSVINSSYDYGSSSSSYDSSCSYDSSSSSSSYDSSSSCSSSSD